MGSQVLLLLVANIDRSHFASCHFALLCWAGFVCCRSWSSACSSHSRDLCLLSFWCLCPRSFSRWVVANCKLMDYVQLLVNSLSVRGFQAPGQRYQLSQMQWGCFEGVWMRDHACQVFLMNIFLLSLPGAGNQGTAGAALLKVHCPKLLAEDGGYTALCTTTHQHHHHLPPTPAPPLLRLAAPRAPSSLAASPALPWEKAPWRARRS